MRKMLLSMALVATTVLCQSYYEAFGQTQVFTLTAGAKAEWYHPGTATGKAMVMPVHSPFYISVAENGLFVHTGAKGVIKLFDVRGRMAVSLPVEHDGLVPFSRGLANGIYVARFEAPGITVKTARLAVVR